MLPEFSAKLYDSLLSYIRPDVIFPEQMVTKRQLGLIFILLGAGAITAMFLIDLLNAGQYQGIGPAQQRALVVAVGVIVLGLSLIPLGDRPA